MLKQYLSGFTKAPLIITSLFVAFVLPFISVPEITRASCTKGTHCDSWGTPEYSGSSWFNGNGVEVYSNGTGTGVWDPNTGTYDVNGYNGDYNCFTISGGTGGNGCSSGTVPTGIEWQCVELFNRFYMTQGLISSEWTGNGNQLINKSPFPTGFSKQQATAVTYVNPGDAITFDDGVDGHVAIVNAVSGSGTTKTIQVVSQNTDGTTFNVSWDTSTNTLTQTYLTGYSVQDIIHAPGGGGGTTYHRPYGIVFNGALNALTVAGDNGLYGQYWNGSSWTGFTNLETNVQSNVSALINTNGNALNLFTRNGDNQVYNAYNPGTGLTTWTSLGSHQMAGNPTSIMRTGSEQDVFALDTSAMPYEDTWTPTSGWSGWTRMVYVTLASNASLAVINYGSETDAIARGGDNNIYKSTTTDGINWGGFGSLGAPSGATPAGDPSVLSYSGEGEYDIWTNTTSGYIFRRTWTGSGWSSWGNWGGTFTGNPYAVQYNSDMYIFAIDGNKNMEYRVWSYANQTWSAWIVLSSGKLASDPYVVQNGSQLTILDNGNDGKTYINTCSQSTCYSSANWGGFSALP